MTINICRYFLDLQLLYTFSSNTHWLILLLFSFSVVMLEFSFSPYQLCAVCAGLVCPAIPVKIFFRKSSF